MTSHYVFYTPIDVFSKHVDILLLMPYLMSISYVIVVVEEILFENVLKTKTMDISTFHFKTTMVKGGVIFYIFMGFIIVVIKITMSCDLSF